MVVLFTGPHSILTVFFDFRRHTGFFLIQVYLPCCLLVILSWVSFWINREATSDRISLGTSHSILSFLISVIHATGVYRTYEQSLLNTSILDSLTAGVSNNPLTRKLNFLLPYSIGLQKYQQLLCSRKKIVV